MNQVTSFGIHEYTIISWDSTKGSIIDALSMLKKEEIHTGFVQIKLLHPFPGEYIKSLLKEYDMNIVKQQFTDSLKPMINAEVITKKKLKKQTENPVEYSLTKGEYAENQAQLILDVGETQA